MSLRSFAYRSAMRSLLRLVVFGLAVVVALSACNGGSTPAPDAAADATATALAPTETPAATPTEEAPTPTPVDEPSPEPTPVATAEPLTDDELIAAAVAAYDADPRPEALAGWDHLGATVRDDGRVELEVCTWDGQSVFDEVRTVLVEVDADGTADVRGAPIAPGECLNTTLIDGVFDAINLHDQVWGEILENPELAATDERLPDILVEELLARRLDQAAQWASDGVVYRGGIFEAALPASATVEVLWQRHSGSEFSVLTCRPLSDEFGLYRGDVLLDDFRSEDAQGDEVAVQHDLVRAHGEWRISLVREFLWSDCQGASDWLAAMNQFLPGPVDWLVLE